MSRNLYKVKKYEDLGKLIGENYFRPLIGVYINKKTLLDEEYYKALKKTLISLSEKKPYICIILVNTNDVQKLFTEDTYNNKVLNKDAYYLAMYYKNNCCSITEYSKNNFMASIVSNIEEWTKSYVSTVLIKNNTQDEHKEVKKEETIKKKEEEEVEEEEEEEEEEDIDDTVESKIREAKQRLLEKQKILKEIQK